MEEDDKPSPPAETHDTHSEGLPKVPISQPKLLRTLGGSKSTVTTAADSNPSKTPSTSEHTMKKQAETSRPLNLLGDISRSPETPCGPAWSGKSLHPSGNRLHSGLLKFVSSTTESNTPIGITPLNDPYKAQLAVALPKSKQNPDATQSCTTKHVGSPTFAFNQAQWPLSVGKEKAEGTSSFFKEEDHSKPFKNEDIVVSTPLQSRGSSNATPQISLKSALKTMVDAPLWQPGMFNMSPKKVAFSDTRQVRIYDSTNDPLRVEHEEIDSEPKGKNVQSGHFLAKKESFPVVHYEDSERSTKKR